jgi:tetratricopeptide (TPR) repeat protein
LFAILVVGAVLRIVYLVEIMHEPDFSFPALDPQFNDYWARAMVSGNWTPPPGYPDPMIRTTPHGRPPGYPYVLAFIYWVSGSSYLAPRLVQMTLGLINGVLMFLLGRALFGRAVGLVAAAFMVTYWAFIHFEGELTYPAFVLLVALLMMHVLRLWARKPSVARALMAGILLGVFALFRPNVVLFGPLLVAWFAWVLRNEKQWRAFFLSSLAAAVGTVVTIAPPLVRNYVVAHDFVFLSSYGGVNLWAGNNENADCVTPKIPHLKQIAGFEDWTCFHYPLIVRGVGRMLGKDNIKFSEVSNYFYQQGMDFITHHPLKTLRLTVKKALIFWGPTETTNDKVLDWTKKKSRLLHVLPGFPFVLAVFVVGSILLFQDLRRQRAAAESAERIRMSAAIFLFIAGYFVSVMPYFVAGRYRIPVIPFLLLAGAYGVVRLVGLAQQRDWRRAGLWSGVGIATCAVGSIQFYSYTPDLAIWHHQRAKAFEQKGELDNAVAEVREELRVNPAYGEGYDFLGKLYEEQGRAEEAEDTYREALKIDPNNDVALNNLAYQVGQKGPVEEALRLYTAALNVNPQLGLAHNNLGNLLLGLGKPDEAIGHFRTALQLDPNDRYAEYNLGNALAAQNHVDEALQHYARALTLDPANPNIPNNLGLALAKQGKYDEAIRWYGEALRLDPEYANAHNNLGLALAAQGKVEDAQRHYEEAVRLNPRFALACNNLGRLLAAHGRKDEAVRQFNRALEIDPKDKNAYLNLGDLSADQGQFETAIEQYRKALENDPQNADLYNSLANALIRMRRIDDAVHYYEMALQLNPRHAGAHCNLGSVLALKGDKASLDAAIQHFRKALEIDPDQATARQGLDAALRKRQS